VAVCRDQGRWACGAVPIHRFPYVPFDFYNGHQRRSAMNRILLVLALTALPVVANACPSLLNHRYISLQGKPVNLCEFAGRPILVVNTASKCGYTPQFEKLEAMHRRYQGRGLVVLGFPSNDFNQELATNKEIAEFCKLTYFVEFPMIEKGSVTGPGANDFFKQLAASAGAAPTWNFHKYLIAPDGKTVQSFGTRVEPDSREIMGKLQPMLK
jgi:glutathione peroxidase